MITAYHHWNLQLGALPAWQRWNNRKQQLKRHPKVNSFTKQPPAQTAKRWVEKPRTSTAIPFGTAQGAPRKQHEFRRHLHVRLRLTQGQLWGSAPRLWDGLSNHLPVPKKGLIKHEDLLLLWPPDYSRAYTRFFSDKGLRKDKPWQIMRF